MGYAYVWVWLSGPLSNLNQCHDVLLWYTGQKSHYPGHNHLLTTGADDPTLWLSPSLALKQ